MKKAGQFLFTFVIFLIVLGLQYLITFFTMGMSGLIENAWYVSAGTASVNDIFTDLGSLWSSQDFNTGIMIVYASFCIGIFGLWYYIKYGGNYFPKAKSVFHPLIFVGVVLLVPGMQFLSTYIINFVAALFPHWLEAYERLLETAGLGDNIPLGMLFYSVILAPISEELIFRGVLFRQAKKALPFWAANIMQGVLFGVFHMNMMQGIYAALLGMVLGYVCHKSGSIYNSILLHVLFNIWGTVLSPYIMIGDSTFSHVFWLAFAIIMTAGGLVVFTFGTKKTTALNTASEN